MKWKRKSYLVLFLTLTVVFTGLLIYLKGDFTASEEMTIKEGYNRLILEKSPYLLQHADNPVDWYPWGQEAFEKAQKENKPIFLSITIS